MKGNLWCGIGKWSAQGPEEIPSTPFFGVTAREIYILPTHYTSFSHFYGADDVAILRGLICHVY